MEALEGARIVLPPNLTLTLSLPFFLIVAVELYLQFDPRLTVLNDRVLLRCLNLMLTRPVQISANVGRVQYLASVTPGGHLSGMQSGLGAFGAQNAFGNLTVPVVLNLYGFFLSRLGDTLDDVEDLVVLDLPTATEVTRNMAINDSTVSTSKRFTANSSDVRDLKT